MEEDTDASTESQVIIPPRNNVARVATPISGTEDISSEPTKVKERRKRKKIKNPKKNLRLVSYNDDTIVSDGEGVEEEEEEESEYETDSDDGAGGNEDTMETEESSLRTGDDLNSKGGAEGASNGGEPEREDRFSKYGFSLPTEPKGKCSAELQDKISLLYEKMRRTNMDMNKVIQERKEFRNPSIYEKLIQFCDINEFGTNYPPEIYDPLIWGEESYYEELAKAQKIEMDRREKEKKDTSKVELALATAKKVEEEAKRRKSKWDQPGPSVGGGAVGGGGGGGVKPAGIIQPALTTNITGTKGTVISAFGSLPKKPKV